MPALKGFDRAAPARTAEKVRKKPLKMGSQGLPRGIVHIGDVLDKVLAGLVFAGEGVKNEEGT